MRETHEIPFGTVLCCFVSAPVSSQTASIQNFEIARISLHFVLTLYCEMNPPDHSDMSQRVASSVAPEVTAVGSAYQEFPVVSDLIDFSPHPEKASTSSSDTELLRNCLCSGKGTDSRNESNDI